MKKTGLKTAFLLSLIVFLSSCGAMAPEPSSSISSTDSSHMIVTSNESESSDPITSEDSSEDSSAKSAESSSSAIESSTQPSSKSSEESIISSEESSVESSNEESSSEESFESSSEATSSESSSSISLPDLEDSPWASLDLSTYGATLRDSLASLIVATGSRTCKYSELNGILSKSDANPNNANSVVPFYRAIDYPSGSWNKEHVWPNSRGTGESGPGSDPQMLRPTLTSDNSSRGNSFYGPNSSNTWDPATFNYAPARGEAARIIFYTATRYAKSHGLSLSNNPSDGTAAKTMGVLRNLIQWNKQYPVTQMEKLRNDRLDGMGFARNPFIDFPELADYIWSENGLRVEPLDGQGGSGEVPSNRYTLIQSLDDIQDGMSVAIVAEAADSPGTYASLSSAIYNNYYLTANLGQREGDYFYPQSSIEEWKITFTNESYKITSGNKVLAVEVSGTHYNLIARENVTANIEWKPMSMASTGKLSLKNTGTSKYMEYFKGDFTCYGTDNGVYFFAR